MLNPSSSPGLVLGLVFGLALVLGLASAASAQSVPFSVPATANIYGAGHATPPAPGGGGGGVLPTRIDLPPGTGRTLVFSNVTGSIDFGPCCPTNGPDGIDSSGSGAAIDWDGIGGMTIARGRFLTGVFLDDTEPMDPVPPDLVIPDIGFTELAPGLRQTFFVGDGLTGTGSGAPQVFQVPDGATRLFLGTQDAGPPNTAVPGFYGDNSGIVTGAVLVTGAPAVPVAGLVGTALLLAAALRVAWSRMRAPC